MKASTPWVPAWRIGRTTGAEGKRHDGARRGAGVEIENRERLERTPAHEAALDCLAAGIDAAHPARVVGEALSLSGAELRVTDVGGGTGEYDLSGFEEVVVAGGGNAAGHLASALADLCGDWIAGGAVVTGNPTEAGPIAVLPGDHPYPSERGVESTRRVLEIAENAGPDDLVIAPITGGGSALLAAPAGSLTVSDLRDVTEALLESGAAIDEITRSGSAARRSRAGDWRRPRHLLRSSDS